MLQYFDVYTGILWRCERSVWRVWMPTPRRGGINMRILIWRDAYRGRGSNKAPWHGVSRGPWQGRTPAGAESSYGSTLPPYIMLQLRQQGTKPAWGMPLEAKTVFTHSRRHVKGDDPCVQKVLTYPASPSRCSHSLFPFLSLNHDLMLPA